MSNDMELIRTERGWAGHFVCALRCSFRRNTLLECGRDRVVVSTVGCMRGSDGEGKPEELGHERYYETMAFDARLLQGTYWEADVAKQLSFESPWAISEVTVNSDNEANDMHEAVVAEFTERMTKGRKTK